ncbi:MAG: MerR family transcriptional regulator [Clostridiales bacterium]|nr:MerR family transcriptional regulator [Clostridiales bacterium]
MTIAAVSRKYALTPDTLRYYERIGLLPPVARTSSGIRDYREDDCSWIEFIKCMRSAGLPIDFLVEYVKLFRQGDETLAQRIRMLKEQRDILAGRIADMHTSLDRLDMKIEHYENMMAPIEHEPKPME